jgi:hypothetical protein
MQLKDPYTVFYRLLVPWLSTYAAADLFEQIGSVYGTMRFLEIADGGGAVRPDYDGWAVVTFDNDQTLTLKKGRMLHG